VDEDEADDRRAEGLAIAPGGRVAGRSVVPGDTHVRIQSPADGLGVREQVRGVGRPGPVVAVGRPAAEEQAGRGAALLVLDRQGRVELGDVGGAQAVRPLPSGQRHHEGARVRPARGLAGVVEDRVEDLARHRVGPEVAHGVPGGGQVGEGFGVHGGDSLGNGGAGESYSGGCLRGAGGAPVATRSGGVSKSATKAPRIGIGCEEKRGISTFLLTHSGSIWAFVADLDNPPPRTGRGGCPRVGRRALRPSGRPRSRTRRFPVERAPPACAFDWKPTRSRKAARRRTQAGPSRPSRAARTPRVTTTGLGGRRWSRPGCG